LQSASGERRADLLGVLDVLVGQSAVENRPSILLVDDDMDMELLVRAALEPWYRVEVARGLDESERAIGNDNYACVLLDLALPDGDGCQVLEGLRKPDSQNVPCLMLTASEEPYRLSEALALGADGFLVKPVSAGLIAAHVTRAIRRHETQSRRIHRDPLTGILNREGLEEAGVRALSFARRTDTPLALAVLDLDGFKRVNDTFGHLVGDQVLRAFSNVLKENLRREDLPARWGGDEFVVMFPNASKHGALRALHNVSEILRGTCLPGIPEASDLRIGFSSGVACLGTTTRTLQDLLRVADERMYANKVGSRTHRTLRSSAS
jgi:diguanylate cyclase (GGDEF)-like protein